HAGREVALMRARPAAPVWCLLLFATPTGAPAQGNTAGATLMSAQRLLEAKRFTEAEGLYTTVLQQLPAGDSTLRAFASFGRAFVVQQRRAAGGDTGSAAPLDVALHD